ncbi:MAG: AAA family ATPase [Planctomycetes bacterium]|nr:AAA family ATPase [Planctomycetota bacterium]
MSSDVEEAVLRERLRAFVAHEHVSELRGRREVWAQCTADRVDAGECVAGLHHAGTLADGTLVFEAPEFLAKFREGEPLFLSDGDDIASGIPVSFGGFDVETSRVSVAPDRYEAQRSSEGALRIEPGVEYCLDRRGLGLQGLLHEGLDSVFRPENSDTRDVLLGRAALAVDADRLDRAREHAQSTRFTEAQTEAFARSVAAEGLVMIQGPPGTGKTRVLAEAALMLARMRCRIFVCGFTHRAVDNLLLAIRALDARVPLFKIGGSRGETSDLADNRIALVRNLERAALPSGGLVVGGTPFSVRRFSADKRFQFVFVDEAGQMPIVHGAIALTAARRHVVCGDPRQLPPVRQGEGRDDVFGTSLYAYLESVTPGIEPILLDRSFRLNDELVRFVSTEFYSSRLQSAESAASRRLEVRRGEGTPLARVLDPAVPLVIASIDHVGRRRRSSEEVRCVADILSALILDGGVAPSEVAVLSPFRAQCRALRHEIELRGLGGSFRLGEERGLVIDTVERMQGQEREVVVLSLAASDRDALTARAKFFYEPGRLNVALTRARTKCIVVASKEVKRARPKALEELCAVATLKRLWRDTEVVDLSPHYLERRISRRRFVDESSEEFEVDATR